MTLLLAGLANGFSVEIDRTVAGFHADSWVVKAGSSGRIASLAPFARSAAARVGATPGVTAAVPVVVIPQTAEISGAHNRSTSSVRRRGPLPAGRH